MDKIARVQLYIDAASAIGYGAYFRGHWLNGYWSPSQASRSLTWKELFPVALACRVWGPQWAQHKLLVHCNNAAVTAIMSSGTCRDPHVKRLVRDIFFSAAQNQFIIFVQHILGTDNSIADSLSRFQMFRFRELVPQADNLPTHDSQPEGWWMA